MSKFKLEEVTYEIERGYSPGFKIIDNDIDIEDMEREDGSIAYLHGISEDEAQSIVVALEKQESKISGCDICNDTSNSRYYENKKYSYCPHCGQKLLFG